MTHVTHNVFDKDYATIHEIKPVLMLKKLTYVGFAVLELSRWLMFDFHYNFVLKKSDDEFLFTNADSLTYEIKSKDASEGFFKHKYFFDFSNYPEDSEVF